jgi:cytidylate kinase
MNVPNLSLSVTEALLRAQTARESETGQAEVPRRHGVIAISREVGALGETIAREVGRRLECPVYDREIVDRIAEELRQPASRLRELDERPTFWIEDWMSGLSREKTISADTYVRHLIATLRGMAEFGRCVIVGRGAPHVLPKESTVRVRFIGARVDRILVIQDRRRCSEREAAAWVDRIDAERTEFVRRTLGVDPTDPHQYDLVLNTSRLLVHECAEVIVQAFLRVETRAGQAG